MATNYLVGDADINTIFAAIGTSVKAGNGLTGGGDLTTDRTLTVQAKADSGISVTSAGIAHSDTSNQSSVDNSGSTVIQDITLDTYGHITKINSKTLSASDLDAVPEAPDTEGQYARTVTGTGQNIVKSWSAIDTSGDYLPLTGGTLTGNLTIDLGSTPADPNDIGYKSYLRIQAPEEEGKSSIYLESREIPELNFHQNGGNKNGLITFDGSHSSTTKIQGGDGILFSNDTGSNNEFWIKCLSEEDAETIYAEAVELYFKGGKRLSTIDAGVEINGSLNVQGETEIVDNNTVGISNILLVRSTQEPATSTIECRSYQDPVIMITATDDSIATLTFKTDDGDARLMCDDGDMSIRTGTTGTGQIMIDAKQGGSVDLYYNNSKELETTSTGVYIDDALTMSTQSAVIFTENPGSYGGVALKGYPSGFSIGWSQAQDGGGIEIYEDYIRGIDDVLTLYYSTSPRLATSSTGVTVTGALEATGDVIAYKNSSVFSADSEPDPDPDHPKVSALGLLTSVDMVEHLLDKIEELEAKLKAAGVEGF